MGRTVLDGLVAFTPRCDGHLLHPRVRGISRLPICVSKYLSWARGTHFERMHAFEFTFAVASRHIQACASIRFYADSFPEPSHAEQLQLSRCKKPCDHFIVLLDVDRLHNQQAHKGCTEHKCSHSKNIMACEWEPSVALQLPNIREDMLGIDVPVSPRP